MSVNVEEAAQSSRMVGEEPRGPGLRQMGGEARGRRVVDGVNEDGHRRVTERREVARAESRRRRPQSLGVPHRSKNERGGMVEIGSDSLADVIFRAKER